MKYILILALILASVSVDAQQYYREFADDTIAVDTNYYPSSTGYVKSKVNTGVVTFTFTHTDVADSLAIARLEGRDNTSQTWTALTGTAILSQTTTDGTSKIYTTTPLTYLYYRAFLSCASGDSVAITDPILMYKED